MEPLKYTPIQNGQIVKLYFNLHKKCLSVKDKKTGLIIAHMDHVLIHNAKFKVSEKGRQRVLRERRKNVHAFIEGEICFDKDFTIDNLDTFGVAYYNPYTTSTFVDLKTQEPIYSSNIVYCLGKKVYYAKNQ